MISNLGNAAPRYGFILNVVMIMILSLVIYYGYGIAWPLGHGRDYGTYLEYYVQMTDSQPTLPVLMLYRTPVAPIVIGATLQLGEGALLEVVYGLFYSISVVSAYYIGSQLSQRTGWFTVLCLWLYPPFAILMHSAGSDSMVGFVWITWCAIVFWTAKTPTLSKFILHGFIALILTLIRPGNMLPLMLFTAFPFTLTNYPLRKRLIQAATYLATVLLLITCWQSYNFYRYGQFTVARGQNAAMLYRIFVNDHLIKPSNGPATQEFLDVIERDLLTKEPYKSYGVDLNELLTVRSPRIYSDLVSLSDRTWGWYANYTMLRDVSFEAISKNFPAYFTSVLIDCLRVMATHYAPGNHYRSPPSSEYLMPIQLNDRGLPIPSEGELIPYSYQWWLATKPDGSLVPEDEFDALEARVDAFPQIPTRDGSAFVANAITTLFTYGYPSMLICIVVGLFGLGVLSPQGTLWKPWTRTIIFLLAISAIIIGLSMATIDMVVPYRLPFDPLFIVFAVAGLIRDGEPSATAAAIHSNGISE